MPELRLGGLGHQQAGGADDEPCVAARAMHLGQPVGDRLELRPHIQLWWIAKGRNVNVNAAPRV
jgi:hypothetical protein